MTEPIQPLRRAADARRPRRRASDNVAQDAPSEDRGLPVAAEPVRAAEPPPPRPAAEAVYAAQLLGQKEVRRGLRGGPEVLDAAQAAYLGAEYSGQLDRRPRKGIMRRTEI